MGDSVEVTDEDEEGEDMEGAANDYVEVEVPVESPPISILTNTEKTSVQHTTSLLTNNDGTQTYVARKTPYRTGSNHNLIISDADEGVRGTLSRMTSKQRA